MEQPMDLSLQRAVPHRPLSAHWNLQINLHRIQPGSLHCLGNHEPKTPGVVAAVPTACYGDAPASFLARIVWAHSFPKAPARYGLIHH